jgi:hypothetical protein
MIEFEETDDSENEPRIIFTGHVRGFECPQCTDPNSIFVQIGDEGWCYRQRALCTNCDRESIWSEPLPAEDREIIDCNIKHFESF